MRTGSYDQTTGARKSRSLLTLDRLASVALLGMAFALVAVPADDTHRHTFGFEKTFVPVSPGGSLSVLLTNECPFPTVVELSLTSFHDFGGPLLVEGEEFAERLNLVAGESAVVAPLSPGDHVLVEAKTVAGPCIAPGRLKVSLASLDRFGRTSVVVAAEERDANTRLMEGRAHASSGVLYVGEAERAVAAIYNGCSTAIASTLIAVDLLGGAVEAVPIELGPGEFGVVQPSAADRIYFSYHYFNNTPLGAGAACPASDVIARVALLTGDGTVAAVARINIVQNESPLPRD